jgi:PEP-CTERM motif
MIKAIRPMAAIFAALMVAAIPIQATTTVLTFEGLQNLEPVLNYYNGGLGGDGSGPGPNYGITFGSDSLAVISVLDGGSGNFSGAPSMPTVLFFLSGPGDVMDDAAGFTTGFSFYYSAISMPGSVDVYSGLDGTGSLLASLTLPVTPEGGSPVCTPGYAYCPWVPIGVSFGGTAESAVFSGSADYIAFDNITLGSSSPSITPEPGTLLLFSSGLLAVGAFLRRRKVTTVAV